MAMLVAGCLVVDKFSASRLQHKIAFYQRAAQDDGYGNTLTDWAKRFAVNAEFIHLRGGEQVQASRLAGRHPQIIRVRRSARIAGVDVSWSIRDERTGKHFNIRDVTPDETREWIDFLCETGGMADG